MATCYSDMRAFTSAGGGDPDVAAQELSTQRAADNLLWLSCPGTLLPE